MLVKTFSSTILCFKVTLSSGSEGAWLYVDDSRDLLENINELDHSC
jgi:hypothetical protein